MRGLKGFIVSVIIFKGNRESVELLNALTS